VNKYMKYGIMYGNWAVLLEVEENDNVKNIIRKSGTYYFIRDWKKELDSKTVSKKIFIAERNLFISHLKNFKNELSNIENALWEIELKKIHNYNKIFELDFCPIVSVILACYNASDTIGKSIRSIIKQTYKNIELVVIDDASTDDSYEKILNAREKYNDKIFNFKVIKNDSNMGAYYSRNIGISSSCGDIIAIQDADDLSDISRISISTYELINSRVEFILANSQKIDEIFELSPVLVAMATLTVARSFFDKYGMYDEKTRHSGDLEILDRAYFRKYGNHEMDNFWYWLNYTEYKEGFYKHIYENLYYVGEGKESITKKNGIKKRLEYLNERRKIEKNKI